MQTAVQQHAEKKNSHNHFTHPTNMALAMLKAKQLQFDKQWQQWFTCQYSETILQVDFLVQDTFAFKEKKSYINEINKSTFCQRKSQYHICQLANMILFTVTLTKFIKPTHCPQNRLEPLFCSTFLFILTNRYNSICCMVITDHASRTINFRSLNRKHHCS